MRLLWNIFRIILGVTFIFSGFVKGIDPWGSTYKFIDYFNAWGMESLTPYALYLGILLPIAEFFIGIALALNIFAFFSSTMSLIFMIFFTIVTLISAITNPVTDCGCFGDALLLTNWQTFFKNLGLLTLAYFIWRSAKLYRARFTLTKMILSFTVIFIFLFLMSYSYNHLPVIDFRPYKKGVNIKEAMTIPEGAPIDIYENTFYYMNKKTGEQKLFDESNYPWQDTLNWEFVSMNPHRVQKGYSPPIQNFTMTNEDGEDLKDIFLDSDIYIFILIAREMNNIEAEKLKGIHELLSYTKTNGLGFIGLTSSNKNDILTFTHDNGFDFAFYFTDPITLKTMIRSEPGLFLLHKGTIVDKWHYNDFPTVEEFKKIRKANSPVDLN